MIFFDSLRVLIDQIDFTNEIYATEEINATGEKNWFC